MIRSLRRYAGFTLVALIGLSACAKQMAPPGGPRDTTSPQIDSTIPPSGSVDVPLDAAVTIAFSEPMKRDDVERSLSIFPAPEHPPELHWDGTRLVITPDTAWNERQTYVVTLQSDARDRRGNAINQSLQVAFSTGTSIDSGAIRGTVLRGGRPQQGAMALCYRVDGDDPDPENDTADYLVQTDSAGHFSFGFLSPGNYRIFGLDDRDRDWLWYVGTEPIGIPSTDIHLAGADTITLPPLSLTPLDTVSPRVSDCRAVSPSCIEISFDSPLDSGRINDIRITGPGLDSTPPALYGLDSQITVVYAVFPRRLQATAHDLVVSMSSRFDSADIQDTCTTHIPDTWDSLFQPVRSMVPDTLSLQSAAADSILFCLRAPVASLTTDSLRWSNTAGDSVAAPTYLTHPFAVVAGIPAPLRMTGPLSVEIPQGFMLDDIGRSWPSDSSRVLHFRFPHLDSSGDYEIHLIGLSEPRALYRLGFRAGASANITSWLRLDSTAKITGYLTPGAYYLELHQDRNGNRRCDPGWPLPIQFSEPVWRFQDSLAVRARFTTELSLDLTARK